MRVNSKAKSGQVEAGGAMSDGTPLSQLAPGQQATIVRVNGSRPIRRRFLEMGFVSGEIVTVERVAPLGDPIAYGIKGYHVSLRRSDAQQILVRVIDQDVND